MWNLRNRTNEQRKKREREINQETDSLFGGRAEVEGERES